MFCLSKKSAYAQLELSLIQKLHFVLVVTKDAQNVTHWNNARNANNFCVFKNPVVSTIVEWGFTQHRIFVLSVFKAVLAVRIH